MTDFVAVIPARYESSRLPGKPLADIEGRPMIAWVYDRAVRSGAREVWIATDDDRIAEVSRAFGANVEMTSSEHQSGTDRIAEVAVKRAWPDDLIVVNVQGDEPLLPPELIRQVAGLLASKPDAAIGTLVTPIRGRADYEDRHTAKVVIDAEGNALYFSRAAIPHAGDGEPPALARRHIGIYAYRVAQLKSLAAAPPCELELSEKLEQLRALYLGYRIAVADAVADAARGVDTEEDLAAVRSLATDMAGGD